jgi:cytochrome c-type biogenesis protein CcmH
MTAFLSFALLLGLIAGAFLVLPLVRRRTPGARAPLAAAVTLLVLLMAALGFYALFGEAYWRAAPADVEPDQSIASLARNVEHHPDDEPGWLRLAEGYAGLGNYALALRCYESANRLSGGRDPAALSGMGEAMLLQEDAGRNDKAAELLERALQIDPRNPKALYYTAVMAYRDGRLELARERFSAMIALGPPESVRTALQRQIEDIDTQLRAQSAGKASGASAAVSPASSASASADATRIRLHVTLSPALARQLPPTGVLFVFVRSADGGPPLAVKRSTLTLPQDLDLSDTDAMVASRAMKPGQDVAVVARISASGSATPSSGDLYGEVRAVAGSGKILPLQIDQRSP